MSDHASGPRALADPTVDITDMYAFPSPERIGRLTLILNVFPFAGSTAAFSDAVDYRFRLRPVQIGATGANARFDVAATEYTVTCHFPTEVAADGTISQRCSCVTDFGPRVTATVGDSVEADGLRLFAGPRLDPFTFDGGRAVETITTGRLSFVEVGTALTERQNVLSVIVEIDTAPLTADGQGPLFAVVGETATRGSLTSRLERFGRPEIKNLVLSAKQYDALNRDLEIRDLFNQEDAFNLSPAYQRAFRARMNANLAFWDSLDDHVDWPLADDGTHPLTELLLADFMVVDIAKPYAEDSALEIEQAMLADRVHTSCGGRSPNDDVVETFMTLLVSAGHGPRVSDGVDGQVVAAGHEFPYLAPPEPNPPPLQLPGAKPAE